MIRAKEFEHPIMKFLGIALFLIGIGIFSYSFFVYDLSKYNIKMWGVFILCVSNVLYAMSDFKKYYIFFFFHIALFTFLIVNPFILMNQGISWWDYYTHESESISQLALFITLIALRVGACLGIGVIDRGESRSKFKTKRKSILKDEDFLKNLRLVSGLIFILTFACGALVGYEKLTFMSGKTYEEFFVSYQSQLPGVINTIYDCSKYVVCLYLASKPSKKMTLLVFIPYILLVVPDFIIGTRNPVILRLILLAVYYVYRHYTDDVKWIGKFEKFCLIFVAPAMIAFLGYYTHIRAGEKITMGVFDAVLDFFLSLGASYSFMCAAFMIMPRIVGQRSVSFMAGPFYEYIFHGTIAQTLFGAVAYGTANSEFKALNGWNFSHAFSYFYDTSGYLGGHGYGSSYLLESYADLGWIGVIVFSIFIGFVCIYLVKMLKSNALSRTIALVALCGIFFIPRAEATDWMAFLVYIQFWAVVLAIMLLAGLLCRKSGYKRFEKYKEEKHISISC